MPAGHMEYAELYARDRQAAVDYFVSLTGFHRVAAAREPDRESELLRQGGVQLVVTGGMEFNRAHPHVPITPTQIAAAVIEARSSAPTSLPARAS